MENNEKIILSEIIGDCINTKQFEHSNEVKQILQYFLEKNIITILGKDEFEKVELMSKTHAMYIVGSKNFLENDTKIVEIEFCYMDALYKVEIFKKSIEFHKNNSSIHFKINLGNVCENSLFSITDENTTDEHQFVWIKDIPNFDYQKVIYNNDGEEIISPAYRARPTRIRTSYIEIFNIENFYKIPSRVDLRKTIGKQQYLQNYLRELVTKKDVIHVSMFNGSNLYSNLPEIFDELEKKSAIESYKRIRLK